MILKIFVHLEMLKIFALFAVTLAKVDHHETQEFWVYPGGEEHTHVGEKVTKEVFFSFRRISNGS